LLRAEARESHKLLEDKKALEGKVRELQATLEVVQNQRNELRQQVRARGSKGWCRQKQANNSWWGGVGSHMGVAGKGGWVAHPPSLISV
jgi:hypothetical protein